MIPSTRVQVINLIVTPHLRKVPMETLLVRHCLSGTPKLPGGKKYLNCVRNGQNTANRLPPESKAADFVEGNRVNIRGFLSKRRVQNAELVFANILVTNGPNIQVTSASSQSYSQALRSIRLHSPVAVTGTITRLDKEDFKAAKPDSPLSRFPSNVVNVELDLVTIKPLNVFPKDIILSRDVEFPASSRHLQIRFSNPLRSRLAARARIGLELRNSLDKVGFTEVETPILFKSTPEGAREFIVPTRSRNLAYALPQSPQQYKQILMSAGIRGYYQFARCFRDEDLRADRQPEFTQLDLEMSFATGQDVMDAVESLVTELPASLNAEFRLVESRGEIHPLPLRNSGNSQERRDAQSGLAWPSFAAPFPRLTYQEVMTRFGIDKPDLRIPFEIRRVDQILPAEFVSMITNLKDQPIVEAFRFRPETRNGNAVESSTTFVKKLINNLPLGIRCHNVPTPIVFNTSKPMCGLSSLGFEGFEALQSCAPGLEDFQDLENGDIIFFLARENKPFQGGSTALGMIRTAVYREAVSMGLLPRNLDFKFLWVVDFPMFMPNNDEDPGQGGSAGFSATHHPFTAPLTDKDVELLTTDPLKARGDHYDLVVNGVELGGGSRRIHLAVLQEYVMRDILRMTDTGVEQFSHLLEALRVGCPPHAGFALGFDRLVAVLTHTESVRDVIAFPKSMKGKDLMVNSPGEITEEQMRTYFPGWRPPTSS
ncbi:tRNA synthetases class II-domain-containing protein [Apodospora peruviana]|uniref:tRNA synthetases class II-domain-containing protein n=1 Tax=Apodospora peruviana TaxID=516989 RepID=A0AAE0IRU8_9PEZI|nr:tRNA synthetases class II-domain-containing protein [Apodospora peruviana]